MFISAISCFMGLYLSLVAVYGVYTQTGDPMADAIVGVAGIAGLLGGLLPGGESRDVVRRNVGPSLAVRPSEPRGSPGARRPSLKST